MKLTKEQAKTIRDMADKPDGYLYYEEIIEQLNSSSKMSKISLSVAIISVVIAAISLAVSIL
ncbi:MAG: hypothetical protein E7402_05705 [Ruminococcaceae bacterium]|nr:hypothetical protein [Oscillospiraceae bacterium]